VALAAAAFAATFALLLRLPAARPHAGPAILFVAVAVVMTAPHLLARPHALAMPFMLLWVAGLVRAVEERRAPEPLLLVCMLLWANLHGGFTLGLMLGGRLRPRSAGHRAPTPASASAVRRLAEVRCRLGSRRLHHAIRRRIDPGDAALSSTWRQPAADHGMAVARLPQMPMQELVLLVALYLALSRGLRLPLLRLLIVIVWCISTCAMPAMPRCWRRWRRSPSLRCWRANGRRCGPTPSRRDS